MAFCTNCGKEIAEEAVVCPGCGVAIPKVESKSKWTGGVLETFIATLIAELIITFTCGLATPWAIAYLWKYIISHAVVDGKKLTFDGNGAQLFGNWIKWFLLTIITCGIYSFWVAPRLYHWITSHTHIDNKK